MSTEKRAFSVSWASWNRQKCPEIVLRFSKNLVLKFQFLLLGALCLWPPQVVSLIKKDGCAKYLSLNTYRHKRH